MRTFSRLDRTWLLFGGLYLFWMALLFRPVLAGIDATGYYSWIQAVVIHHNLNVDPLFLARACRGVSTGCFFHRNPYGIGVALFLSPFFLLAHGLAPLAHAPQNGLSRPYIVLCSFGASVWGMAGLLLSWQAAQRICSRRAATLAALTLWMGSPLLFYMIPNNLLSHAEDVFVNALFLWLYLRTRGPERKRTWLGYGAIVGLAMMVRMPNVLLLCLPLADSLARLMRRERRFGPEAIRYVLLGMALLAALTPQMVVWKLTRGHWLVLNPYHGATGDYSDFLHPHLWQVLFSTNHGFLMWAPAFLLALLGVPLLARRDRALTAGLLTIMLLNYFLVASWDYWNGDAAFGPRLFLNLIPIAVLGGALLIDWAASRVSLRVLTAVAACLVLWTVGLMGQYALRLIPTQTGVPFAVVLHNQLTLIPDHFGHLLTALKGRHAVH